MQENKIIKIPVNEIIKIKNYKKQKMAVEIDQKTVIHHHPITLPASLGIARKIVGEEKEKKGG